MKKNSSSQKDCIEFFLFCLLNENINRLYDRSVWGYTLVLVSFALYLFSFQFEYVNKRERERNAREEKIFKRIHFIAIFVRFSLYQLNIQSSIVVYTIRIDSIQKNRNNKKKGTLPKLSYEADKHIFSRFIFCFETKSKPSRYICSETAV